MVTSNDHHMILFPTAHVLHIPIEYHQKRLEDKDVNVCMGHYFNKEICAGMLQIPQLYLYNVF